MYEYSVPLRFIGTSASPLLFKKGLDKLKLAAGPNDWYPRSLLYQTYAHAWTALSDFIVIIHGRLQSAAPDAASDIEGPGLEGVESARLQLRVLAPVVRDAAPENP